MNAADQDVAFGCQLRQLLHFGTIEMRNFMFIVVIALMSTGCSSMYAHLTYEFKRLEQDDRIYYESAADDIATLAAKELANAIQLIKDGEYVKFKQPQVIKVYVFNDRARYSEYSNSSIESRGSASANEIYLSPKLRDSLDSLPSILAHELSHIHLRQFVGTWRYITDIPGWYHEGMAVISSNGGGAEKVSHNEAIQSIISGHYFVPRENGSIFGHQSAHDYGLKPHMYYRQAELFVRYLKDYDANAFKMSYIGIINGEKFSEVWKKHYGLNIAMLWKMFLNNVAA